MKRNENTVRHLLDNIKHANIHFIAVAEEETKKGPKKMFAEIIT